MTKKKTNVNKTQKKMKTLKHIKIHQPQVQII